VLSASVVVPTFNCASLLPTAIASATAQQDAMLRITVVDDASTDETERLVATIGPHIRYLRNASNGGVSVTRNVGIRTSSEDIIFLLDSDDSWDPTKAARQRSLLERRPDIDFVFSDFDHVDRTGVRRRPWNVGILEHMRGIGVTLEKIDDDTYLLSDDAAEALVRHKSFIHPSTVAVRRVLFDRVGLFDETIRSAEDLDLWIRCALAARMAYIDRRLASARSDASGLSRNLELAAEGSLRVIEKLPGYSPDLAARLRTDIRAQKAEALVTLAWCARLDGRHWDTLRAALASFLCRPSHNAGRLALAAFLPRRHERPRGTIAPGGVA
jgi:glycosyltransferase involved in cell wall biosynthesis